MSFLNPMLLLGLGLIAIPVVLHFLMRQKPRRLIFPALRLIQQRQRQSVRRLRLRHLFLMLLRILAIGLIVCALARPSLPPANYGLSLSETITLLTLTIAGVAYYFWCAARLRRQRLSEFQHREQRSRWRNRILFGTLLAILLGVGWPYQRRIAAEITTPQSATRLDLPVAGIMLFDNSLSMSSLQAGTTTLDQAREIAEAHLQSLPPGSRIAVADTSSDRPIPFQSTMLSAQSRLQALAPSPVALPIDDRLREALKAQEDDRKRTLQDLPAAASKDTRDRYIRRIYLFTDLAKSAWRPAGSQLLLADLERQKAINLYLIDVGQSQGRNQAITGITLSGERIPIGGELVVSATAQSQGQDVKRQGIELLFQNRQGEQVKQGQTTLDLDENLPAQAQFPIIGGLTNHWVHGETRLLGTDPLAFDNIRYFTVEVSEPPPVLVIAPREELAAEWMAALAPHDRLGSSLNKFKPVFQPLSRLSELKLSDYPVVTLIDCPRMTSSDDGWIQLGRYVESGGGLIVVLGSDDISAASYNRAQSQQFLPGLLDAWQSIGEYHFSVSVPTHPLFSIYRRLEPYGSFSMFENLVTVNRFWKVTPAAGANVVATYDDAQRWPAILERPYGQGRVVMITTDVHLPENSNERWNNFPSPVLDAWLFLTFVEQTTNFASKFADEHHSFLCGQTAVIHVDPAGQDRTFLLKEPNLKQSRQVIPAGSSALVLKDLTEPGHYELVEPESRATVGAFSLNPPASESDLTRLTEKDLDDRLGAERYQLAESLEDLKDDINAADIGQEVFPVLLALVIVVFCGEHLVANRFYETPGPAPEGQSKLLSPEPSQRTF